LTAVDRVKRSAITIKDVAARAGVSPKTVSRVINGEQHVRPEIREAVMRVVAELDYHPNAFARGLSSSRSFLLGIFFDDPASGYAADVQRGALERCRAWSHHLVVEAVDREGADWMARVDGSLREVRRPPVTGPTSWTCSSSTAFPTSGSRPAPPRTARRGCASTIAAPPGR